MAAVLLFALHISGQAAPNKDATLEIRELSERALGLYDQGQYQEGIRVAERAVELSQKQLGLQHAETANSLDTLAKLHRGMGADTVTEPLYRQALAIREQLFGPEHLEIATSLNNLGLLYISTSAYAKAEPLLQRALAMREKALGSEHPTTADSLNSLALLYKTMALYARAEPLYRRALSIREKTQGPKHPKTADSLNNLANLYFDIGAYAKAEPMFQRALTISEQALGAEHPKIPTRLNNLANLYYVTGAYPKAESLYQRAVAISEKVMGTEHPDTGMWLSNLANLYADTGAHSKAESLYLRAAAISEKVYGPEDPDITASLNGLADLYTESGAYAKAETLYQRVLAISEKFKGLEHPDTANLLNNIANLYTKTGAYSRAEPLVLRALAIHQKVLGPDHPQVAKSLDHLANLHFALGRYDKAESLHRQALVLYEKSLGPWHPETALCLSALAEVSWARGDSLKALASLERTQLIQARNSGHLLLTGSESRKRAYLQYMAKNTHTNVSFSVAARSPGSISLALTSVLQYKGRVQDEMSGSVARLRQSVEPADRKVFDQFAQVGSEFSTLAYQGLGNLSPAQYQQHLDVLHQRQEALEAELAKRSLKFRRQVTPVTLTAVHRAIPRNSALVEWIRFQPVDPKVSGPNSQHRSPRYAAYVLKASGAPDLVDVGEAQVIETLVRRYLEAVQNPTRGDIKERTRELSDQIVIPLLAHLQDTERLLMSPDGILNLVPMVALVDTSGRYLIDRFEITYLTSGRDILRLASTSSSQSGAIVFADPDYGKPLRSLPPVQPSQQAQRSADLDRSGLFFRPLPNTAAEARTIKSLLKLDDTNVLLRIEATESNLKKLHGPRILHVASHGFFLRDQDLVAQFGPTTGRTIQGSENSQLRSGIALAGANPRRSGPNDDGILTALEATQLDLQGTELVVLSACDTGVGSVQNGEGVYGLRRALFIAGAQTQIASLWKVMDGATRTLMEDYYRRLLKGEGRSASLRQAQQKMLAVPQRSHPYYWASFVPIGNWAPLTAKR